MECNTNVTIYNPPRPQSGERILARSWVPERSMVVISPMHAIVPIITLTPVHPGEALPAPSDVFTSSVVFPRLTMEPQWGCKPDRSSIVLLSEANDRIPVYLTSFFPVCLLSSEKQWLRGWIDSSPFQLWWMELALASKRCSGLDANLSITPPPWLPADPEN